jgi:putative FmdB family regulatory protein
MPTYEYGCTACGKEWEEIQRITEPPIEVCPACGKAAAHRLISAGTGFILKGGGWYSDLYSSAKPAPAKAESAPGEASSGSAGTSEASTASGGGTKAESASKADSSATKSDSKASSSASSTAPTASSS